MLVLAILIHLHQQYFYTLKNMISTMYMSSVVQGVTAIVNHLHVVLPVSEKVGQIVMRV
jgi:hypothetical protein